jgi:GlpG protein
MIKLATFSHPRAAQAFVDYLNQQKLFSQLLKDNDEFVVYLKDAEHEFLALQELEAFQQNPNAPKYLNASWQTGVQYNSSTGLGLSQYLANIKNASGWLTQLLILICLISFAVMSLSGVNNYMLWFSFAPLSELTQSHQWWRLLTPIAIHFSATHLVFNLVWLWYLGGRIEVELSSKALLIVVLSTALVSNYGQFITDGNAFGGMSGVVYGLLGFCWIYGHIHPRTNIQLSKAIVGFMLIWLIIGYADVLWVNMANTAHLAGLLSGCALALLFHLASSRSTDISN